MVASRVVEGVRLLYCHTLTLTKNPPEWLGLEDYIAGDLDAESDLDSGEGE